MHVRNYVNKERSNWSVILIRLNRVNGTPESNSGPRPLQISNQNCPELVSTYPCFSADSLAKFVEIDEKFFDTDSILGDARLNALLNVVLVRQSGRLALVVALMAMSCRAHVLHVIAD